MASEDVVIDRDFGLMLSDFSRIFPRVWPNSERLNDSSVKVNLALSGSVEITLSEQKLRKLATLRMPYVDIRFHFISTTDKQRIEFFEEFERSFQKGGG